MKINRQSDILINVLFPLFAGYIIYVADFFSTSLQVVRNYFPDGLWAYSFLSAIVVIWNRHINLTWIILIFSASAGFEFMQYKHITAGTGDILDFLSYGAFFGLALYLNRYFKKRYTTIVKPL